MIDNVKWYLGGTFETTISEDFSNDYWYTYERGASVYSGNSTNWIGKVGLMYPSDYGYATSGGSTTSREECLAKWLGEWNDSNYSDCKNNDWLYDSSNSKWTITPLTDRVDAIIINNSKPGRGGTVSFTYPVHPVVYLSSNVGITGGVGTSNDPYQLSV